MNLGSYIRECEVRTGFNDTNFQERWRKFINAAVRDFARKYPWPGLEREIGATLESSARYLVLPHYVDHVTAILNTTDRVPILPAGDWTRQSPAVYSNLTTGRPIEYSSAGHVATSGDPSGFIWFASENASDVGSLYVTGYAAASGSSSSTFDSVLRAESISANGVSPVTLTVQFAQVLSISKATSTNGDFYFHDASGGSPNPYISYIPAADQDARFRRLEFQFVPDGSRTLRIKYLATVPALVNDQQSPHPTVKDDYVVEKAIAFYQRYQSQYTKGQFHDVMALDTLASETHKEENFSELQSFIHPEIPGSHTGDPSSDYYKGGY